MIKFFFSSFRILFWHGTKKESFHIFFTFARFWFLVGHINWFPRSAMGNGHWACQEATWELERSTCTGYLDRVRTINLTMRIKTFNTVKETGGVQSMGKRFEKKNITYTYLFWLMSENRSPMFIRSETVAGQENMIPCGVAKEKNSYSEKRTRLYS